MQLFYTPQILQNQNVLDETESKHCVRVLRMTEGDEIQLIDGQGGLYTAQITDAHSKTCKFRITDKQEIANKRPYTLTIAIAPTKNIDRFEWFLEKATEIGIDEIVPMLCEHSERKVIKHERLEKIVIAAMKQSLKAHKPVIHPLTSFKDYLSQVPGELKCIAHCQPSPRQRFKDVVKPTHITVLIGPEGDFSDAEIKLARDNGLVEISLGESRLRTETAGVMASAIPAVVL
ncbi:MAG: 16S rRNA (uracil(1498)-N(3))-methyltransferase [Bacteroidetes bacterium]|nr:16S rRNA (uracil(1498)-N(3))-methyltransferase [Bacteroidota bacterium]